MTGSWWAYQPPRAIRAMTEYIELLVAVLNLILVAIALNEKR